MPKKILGIIPARGGSKGIPRKNIRSIAGKPLIAWTIEAALASSLTSVIVSTDDAEIAQLSIQYGAQVPFLRPRDLALDETPGLSVLMHAIDQLQGLDAVLLLQPTSPLRSVADIDACIDIMVNSSVPSVVSVVESRAHPSWMYKLGGSNSLMPVEKDSVHRRQDLPPVFLLNGAIYLSDIAWIRSGSKLIGGESIGYVMPPERSVDIDDMLDWRIAEMLLKGFANE